MAFAALLVNPYVLLLLGFTLLSALYSHIKKRTTLPDLPWINRDPDQWFSKFRARLRTTLNYRDALGLAYMVCV